ncbi:MAG: nuclear transport factor 2 family protein [Saprospiraceae bacterium]|nr:nuclear transport factor 2 family protein [Saprospiraceae bacterium]
MKKLIFILLGIFLLSCTKIQIPDRDLINSYLDDWHLAAANADFDGYFDKIADDGIYIGTDPTERWTKDEFVKAYKPYFDKGKAWDFKAIERNIDFSKDGKVAWFDEKLDTWMGICRASGVLELIDGNWKIKHYHLSVTILNERTKEFVEMNKK